LRNFAAPAALVSSSEEVRTSFRSVMSIFSLFDRPYKQLLADCMQQLSEVAPRHFPSNKLVLQLACELAAHPQTYEAILQVIDPLHQNLQGHRSAADTAPVRIAFIP